MVCANPAGIATFRPAFAAVVWIPRGSRFTAVLTVVVTVGVARVAAVDHALQSRGLTLHGPVRWLADHVVGAAARDEGQVGLAVARIAVAVAQSGRVFRAWIAPRLTRRAPVVGRRLAAARVRATATPFSLALDNAAGTRAAATFEDDSGGGAGCRRCDTILRDDAGTTGTRAPRYLGRRTAASGGGGAVRRGRCLLREVLHGTG